MQESPDAYTLDKATGDRTYECASHRPCKPMYKRLGGLLPGRHSLPPQAGRETAPWQGPSWALPALAVHLGDANLNLARFGLLGLGQMQG
jgi:hypothetical protein